MTYTLEFWLIDGCSPSGGFGPALMKERLRHFSTREGARRAAVLMGTQGYWVEGAAGCWYIPPSCFAVIEIQEEPVK